jgi:hypothetical protein
MSRKLLQEKQPSESFVAVQRSRCAGKELGLRSYYRGVVNIYDSARLILLKILADLLLFLALSRAGLAVLIASLLPLPPILHLPRAAIRRLHHLQVALAGDVVVDDGERIILAYYTACFLLHGKRSFPRRKNVFSRHVLENWDEMTDVVAVGIVLLAERNRGVHSVVLMEEGRGRQPHPVAVVNSPISIEQKPVENFSARLPALPQVSPGQETRHAMSRQMMDPAPAPSVTINH